MSTSLGSSPLARGLPPRPLGLHGARRIIPARAGFTRNLLCCLSPIRDHPRSRGVYIAGHSRLTWPPGSSPLARGLRRLPHRGLQRPGIIPARAGFTLSASKGPSPAGDHPRSRGVYVYWCMSADHDPGSSPLARGLRKDSSVYAGRRRIIPARAGFTRPVRRRGRAGRDHPRSRGVYLNGEHEAFPDGGSSPLARGLRPAGAGRLDPEGIIPARAGFTHPRLRRHARGPDHPRSRGVYRRPGRFLTPSEGSSPLARGLPSRAPERPAPGRIIPARAGFTGHLVRITGMRQDHPRSRGVYKVTLCSGVLDVGSSPLARGLRVVAASRRSTTGIIPARAGFTAPLHARPAGHRDHPRSRGVYSNAPGDGAVASGSSPLARGLRGGGGG